MTRLAGLCLLLGAAACAPDPEPAAPPGAPALEAAPDTVEAGAPEAARPASVTDTLRVEGTPEPIDLRLVTYADVPLPFSTYLPEGWDDDVLGSGEGTAVRFTMGEASLSLFVPMHAATEADVTDLARAVADSRGGARPLEPPGAWARSAFAFAEGGRVGTVRVGAHGGTFFYVLEDYPVEYGDGFAPRARLVLDRLRWADGAGL